MAILKIRDANGDVHEILVIRGEPGKDGELTEEELARKMETIIEDDLLNAGPITEAINDNARELADAISKDNVSSAIIDNQLVKVDSNDGMLHYSNPHDSENIQVTAAQVGAAPAGYGLGGSKWLNSQKDANGNEIGGWNLALKSGFYSSSFNCPQKGKNHYIGIVVNYTDDCGMQIAWEAYPDANKNDVFMRAFVGNQFRAWEEWSPSAFAPAGYGYGGERLPVLDGASTDEINAGIVELIKAMPSIFNTRQFKCKNPVQGGGHLYGTIYKQNDSNAVVVLHQLAYRYELRGQYTNGGWEEWEWSNPPMTLGVEYRTTERFNGKPVYTKLINAGYLPASRLSKWITVSTEQVDVIDIKAFLTKSEEENRGYFPIPSHHDSDVTDGLSAYIAYAAYVTVGATGTKETRINMIPTKDMSAYSAYVTVKYIKNETAEE